MSRGKYMSLQEARETGKIDQFCEEHPSEGDGTRFETLLSAMARRRPANDQTSAQGSASYCSDTQTPSRTSEDASGKRGRASRESTASTVPKTPRSR